MKLLLVLGTRPEAIKQAPLILAARRHAPDVTPVVLSTGQHRDMVRPILAFFGIKPDIDLDLMQPGQTLSALAARALVAIDGVLEREEPAAVVVQGDTTTAMCAALAAFHRRVPVAHLEAGLRSDRLDAPYPEEANRRIISQMARLHLAPTESARAYLERDRVPLLGGRIDVTGNTVIDALYMAEEGIRKSPPQDPALDLMGDWKKGGDGRKVVLVTGHRRENFGKPFEEFCLGLRDIAEAHPNALLVYPVHLNPNVQKPVREILGDTKNIRLVPVAGYLEFVAMMIASDFIITDSGGVQEEAPALGKPVLVTRDVTERPEAVEAGSVKLVGPHRRALFEAANALLTDRAVYDAMAQRRSPYGDGRAGERCIQAILESFGGG
ncbi:MAG: UDP-N-acetylglucosamine 2-epimerase (non-hydrolyzing) [Candidatus Sumerlaeia bacterium]|nr:UDP-N-acetylglucosamine 2-epimerase (non-hydrolyzing) [Candidatus Sumerlaeia bacterium]